MCIWCDLVSNSNKPLNKLMDHTGRIQIKVAQECVDLLGLPYQFIGTLIPRSMISRLPNPSMRQLQSCQHSSTGAWRHAYFPVSMIWPISPVVHVSLGNKPDLGKELGTLHVGQDEVLECCNQAVNCCVHIHSDYGSTKKCGSRLSLVAFYLTLVHKVGTLRNWVDYLCHFVSILLVLGEVDSNHRNLPQFQCHYCPAIMDAWICQSKSTVVV
jgi:hypothetical protein